MKTISTFLFIIVLLASACSKDEVPSAFTDPKDDSAAAAYKKLSDYEKNKMKALIGTWKTDSVVTHYLYADGSDSAVVNHSRGQDLGILYSFHSVFKSELKMPNLSILASGYFSVHHGPEDTLFTGIGQPYIINKLTEKNMVLRAAFPSTSESITVAGWSYFTKK